MPTDYIKNLVNQKIHKFEQFYEISITGFKEMESDIKYLHENNYETLQSSNPQFLGVRATKTKNANKLEKSI